MKKIILVSSAIFMQSAISLPTFQSMEITHLAKSLSTNTIMREQSSLKDTAQLSIPKRTIDYPTQIVRMQGELKGTSQRCDEILNQLQAFFGDYITYDKFFYN